MPLNGPMTQTTDSYASVNGVRMWYDVHGEGAPLVLLHGGLSDIRDFNGNLGSLDRHFRVYLPDRRGHGHTADVDGPITAELMAADLVEFLEQVVGGRARLAGFSAGAAVALTRHRRRPAGDPSRYVAPAAVREAGPVHGDHHRLPDDRSRTNPDADPTRGKQHLKAAEPPGGNMSVPFKLGASDFCERCRHGFGVSASQ